MWLNCGTACLRYYGCCSLCEFEGVQDRFMKNKFVRDIKAWECMCWGVHEPQIIGAWKSVWESTTVFTVFLHLILVTAS